MIKRKLKVSLKISLKFIILNFRKELWKVEIILRVMVFFPYFATGFCPNKNPDSIASRGVQGRYNQNTL